MSLPHGDVLCDSLRKRCTAKWNLFLLRSKGQNNMHTNVRLWIKATCGPSAKLTDLLMSNRVSSMMLMVKLESWGYSHKSRNAWASCFWLTRTPELCQCDLVQRWCLCGTTQHLPGMFCQCQLFCNEDPITEAFKIRKHSNIIFTTCSSWIDFTFVLVVKCDK